MTAGACNLCGAGVVLELDPAGVPRTWCRELVWAELRRDLDPTHLELTTAAGRALCLYVQEREGGLRLWAVEQPPEELRQRRDHAVEAYPLHAPRCHVRRRQEAARALEGPPVPRVQALERGRCTGSHGVPGCGQELLWVLSAANRKPVPLDPAPRTGVVLDKEEARQLRGQPELVRGYTAAGEVVAIREGGQAGLLELQEERATATVWVTHWATCPERRALRRMRPRKGR